MQTYVFDPVRRGQIMTVPGYYVWCGSIVRTPDGRCHLFLSMWEEKWGFEYGWATHSKIGYAVSDTPDGEYTFCGIVFDGSRQKNAWDRDSVHNPYVLWHDGVFYLYYSGNRGDETAPTLLIPRRSVLALRIRSIRQRGLPGWTSRSCHRARENSTAAGRQIPAFAGWRTDGS